MIAAWMVSLLATGVLLAIVGVSAESLAARLRAPRRAVWIAVMLMMCVLPLMLRHLPAPLSPRRVMTAAVDGSSQASAGVPSSSPGVVPAQVAAAAEPEIELAPSIALRSTNAVVFVHESVLHQIDTPLRALLIIGSLGAMLILLVATLRIRRARRQWSSADAEITAAVSHAAGRDVRVWRSPNVGPAAFGVRHPQVVLPLWVETLDDEARTLLIAHEGSHIAARDPLLLRVALSLVVLMPWNLPLLFAYRRLHRAVEHDCDSRVLRGTSDARSYGRLLVATAQRMTHAGAAPSWSGVARWLPSPVAGIGIRRSDLELRLRALVRPASCWRSRLRALGAGTALIAAGVSACSVPTPERTVAGAAIDTAAMRSAGSTAAGLVLARDDRTGRAHASVLDTLLAVEEFMAKVFPRADELRDSLIRDVAQRALPELFADTATEKIGWLLLDKDYQVLRANTGRQFASLSRAASVGRSTERVAATPTTPLTQLSVGVDEYVRAFPGITRQNIRSSYSVITLRSGARAFDVHWARYTPTPSGDDSRRNRGLLLAPSSDAIYP